jgi:hypothetical protein
MEKKIMASTKQILVTGDLTIDRNLYKGENITPDTRSQNGTRFIETFGGAYQLFELMSHFSNENLKVDFGYNKSVLNDASKFPQNQASYAVWEKVNYREKVEGVEKAWKVTEPLGFGPYECEETSKEKTDFLVKGLDKKITNPDIVVFDDSANQFRNNSDLWDHILKTESEKVLYVLKMASPLCKGKLFSQLTEKFKDELVIITSIGEIREEDVMISKGISWEQTALDLIYELQNNKSVTRLLKCRHLIVTIQSEGALYLEIRNEIIYKARIIFDPEFQDGEWDNAKGLKGTVVGLMNCFTAGVVSGLAENNSNIDLAISKGLIAQRKYKILGQTVNNLKTMIPAEKLYDKNNENKFASAFVPIPENNKKSKNQDFEFTKYEWTILDGNYMKKEAIKPLFDMGLRVALFGENELKNSPFLKKKNLITYDRTEIEAIKNIENLIKDYIQSKKEEKPLSLAVFGAPGSGKSFAVKQLAKSQDIHFVEFNLSQFEDENELTGAFHQVRDKVLEFGCPIIFWDEFDSQKYKWLQYLLAPMQDGKFQEGQITHHIGKCVFIFAGGTSYNFETFGPANPNYPEKDNADFNKALKEFELNQERFNDFKAKKGPDFKSRLSAYLNVKGPNQLETLDGDGNVRKDKNGNPITDPKDIFYPVRRALFIRNIFGVKPDKELNVDYGLLNALIKTTKYKHGSRSLEKILLYMKMKDGSNLKRANLPPHSILSMQVDFDNFIQLMKEADDFMIDAFRIAPEIHKNWMEIGDKEGWKLEYHKNYNLLPAHLKDENIAAALRIPDLLDSLGYQIVPECEAEFYTAVDFNKIISDKATLEKLAIIEHEGWVDYKKKNGWKYAEERNDDKKIHDCIIEWEKLSDKDKNKDKDAVQNYKKVLESAKFVIVKKD